MKQFIEDVRKNAISHGSLPFWSWNDKLEEKELRRQINNMHELNANGFFMHARGGLETEYMSEEWFDAIKICIDEAKKLGMQAWLYDENGWPSGFAGGKLLKDKSNQATYLVYEKANEFPKDENVLGVYVLIDNAPKRVTAPQGEGEYHIVKQCWDCSYVDTMDKSITKKYIALTHEEYKKRLPAEDFGKTAPGFFTDEPQYYRYATPWSNKMCEEFFNAYGYDVLDKLCALFIECEGYKEFRFDYYKLCHTLYIQNFIKPIYEWCRENNCRLTGHTIEETTLNMQMWCSGGVMPFYEYEDIPGIDYLSRNINDDVAARQIGSVCAQLGKTSVLSEMFACCGWDVTPKELKKIAELQYAGGVNTMCQHLYAYSERGQRKRDYPAHFSKHLPWQEKMKAFNGYFNNLGYMLSLGTECVNTLAIHPIHSAYLTYHRELDRESIAMLEDHFHALSDKLSQSQIQYHWGDETLLAKYGSVENGKLIVGKCEYKYVVIPSFETIDATTAELLKKYIACGGRVYVFGLHIENGIIPSRIEGRIADTSWIKENISFEEIERASLLNIEGERTTIKHQIRSTEYGKLYYTVNLSTERLKDKIKLKGVEGVKEIDIATLEERSVCGKTENGYFVFDEIFEDGQAHMYIESKIDDTACAKKEACAILFDKPFTLAEKPENQLTLDRFALSLDGGKTFSELRPIERIRDNLLSMRYKGEVTLKCEFEIKEITDKLTLFLEPLKNAKYSLNGNEVLPTERYWFDNCFKAVDVLPYAKIGKNEFAVTFDYFQRDYVYWVLYSGVSESLRNCLLFDTEIECMYLVGDFAVETLGKFTRQERNAFTYEGDFALKAQGGEVNSENIVLSGYPFFAGTVRFSNMYVYETGKGTVLNITGRFAVADVYVNGDLVKTLMFESSCDLCNYLKQGENTIEIAITSSCRNLLGPHHTVDPEPYGVTPQTFSFEKEWQDGKCSAYMSRYSFVRFGFDII